MLRLLVTGGAGFIGSNFVRFWLARHPGDRVVNLDALTYAGNLESLCDIETSPQYRFVRGDICDRALVETVLRDESIDCIVHFAAESHVDRSIAGPAAFIRTNVEGTFSLLEAARGAWGSDDRRRFLHVSTDEAYGSLGEAEPAFDETHPYRPNNPYSASKAASDHLVRAYFKTYHLPVLTTHCSNNYGPYQFPEKLIPLVILNALEGKPLPVYGDGLQIRDWLHVEDHCRGIEAVLLRGDVGQVFNIGAGNERSNIDTVRAVCACLDDLHPAGAPHASLIRFVDDRPGHDRRYAIDSGKIRSRLNWAPEQAFESGLNSTVQWYLSHPEWCAHIRSGEYRHDQPGSPA